MKPINYWEYWNGNRFIPISWEALPYKTYARYSKNPDLLRMKSSDQVAPIVNTDKIPNEIKAYLLLEGN